MDSSGLATIAAGAVIILMPPSPSPASLPSTSPSPAGAGMPTSASQLQSPAPVIVTDVARDGVDWLVTITTIVSAVIGVVAIIVALRANDRVKRSEEKALTRADRERRTLFDFEILRDLLAQLDDNATYAFVKHVGSSMEQKVGARLAMLPADSLPVWRGLKSATTRLDIVAKYRAAARPADPQLFDRQIDAYINGSGSPPLELVSAVREALRVDIQEAVAERMESLRAVG